MLAELFLLASGSAVALAEVTKGLEIDEDAITRNLHDAEWATSARAELLSRRCWRRWTDGMAFTTRSGVRLDSAVERPVLVLLNSTGTDTALWDAAVPLLIPAFRLLRIDARAWRVGHAGGGLPPCDTGGRCRRGNSGRGRRAGGGGGGAAGRSHASVDRADDHQCAGAGRSSRCTSASGCRRAGSCRTN